MTRKYAWKDPTTKNYRRFRKAARLKEKAQTRGDVKYQGVDCKYKHGGIRYAQSGACVTCVLNRPRVKV